MSQSTKDYFKSEMERAISEAQAITEKVEAELRDVTDVEAEQVKSLIEEATEFKAKLAKIEATENLREGVQKIAASFNTPVEETEKEPTSIGDAFTKSEAYKSKFGARTGTWSTGAVDVGTKANVTTVLSPVVQPGAVQGPFPILTEQRHVADLFPQGTTDSNTVPVVRETTATNAAAGVAEAAAKPESTLVFTQANEPVKKIATFIPVSDEFFEDVAGMRSYIDGRLGGFVLDAEDSQLLVGAGAGNNVQGVQTRVGVQTATLAALKTSSGAVNPTVADAVYSAITSIRVNAFCEPNGAVFHPTNWMAVRLLKDSADQYFGGGPFTGAYGNSGGISGDNIWGLSVVVTSRETLHTALVGDFRQGMIFRKGGLTVEATNSHASFFIENLVAIRAEERLALAIFRPAAWHLITALNV